MRIADRYYKYMCVFGTLLMLQYILCIAEQNPNLWLHMAFLLACALFSSFMHVLQFEKLCTQIRDTNYPLLRPLTSSGLLLDKSNVVLLKPYRKSENESDQANLFTCNVIQQLMAKDPKFTKIIIRRAKYLGIVKSISSVGSNA
jgi:hypothetical protein